jgi:uncharacterized RDD family membrane protein YckC
LLLWLIETDVFQLPQLHKHLNVVRNLMIEDKYRTGTKRFFAALIDGLVFIPFMFLDNYVRSINNNSLIILTTSIITLSSVAYSVFFHAKYGQTLGKMAVDIKVVDVSEAKPISIRQAFIRDGIWFGIEVAGIIYFSLQLMKTASGNIVSENYDGFIDIVSFSWVVLELVSMLTNAKRRAIHDFLAKTVVVGTK